MRRRTRNWLIGAVALLALLYFGVGLTCFLVIGNVRGSCGEHAANHPGRILFDDNWPELDLEAYTIPTYEAVRFPSRQPSLSIAGWWADAGPGAPAVILVHGLGGCKNAIDILVPAGMLWRNGFNVLMIDVRDVGDSDEEDGWTSAGNDESLDVLGAWDWLVATKGYSPERIGLFGVSMGGATSLYAFHQEPRMAALFLEGTFASLLATVADQLTGYGVPGLVAQPASAVFRLVSREDIMAHTPIEAIRTAGQPPV